MSTDYPNMFSPIEIRGKTCPNKIFFAPTCTCLGNADGSVNDSVLAWINARARGGAGMIVSEVIRCGDRFGTEFAGVLGIPDDYKKEGFRMYNDIAKHYGAVSIAQLSLGFGKQALPQFGEYVSSSAIPLEIREGSCDSGLKIYEGFTFPAPRELTTEEVDALIEDYKAAAVRLKACGFDGIELHGCHGYLLWQFMSPAHNQRTDKYGGSEEARLNVPLTLLRAVREIGGDDFIVGYRCSSDEGWEGGLTLEDMQRIVPILVENGADFISLSRGFSGNLKLQYPATEGTMVEVHSKIKEVSKVPVFHPISRIPEPEKRLLPKGKWT